MNFFFSWIRGGLLYVFTVMKRNKSNRKLERVDIASSSYKATTLLSSVVKISQFTSKMSKICLMKIARG